MPKRAAKPARRSARQKPVRKKAARRTAAASASAPPAVPWAQAPLRIGLIGSGFNARFHIRSLVSVRDVAVAGVTSPHEKHASQAAQLARDLGVGDPVVFESSEALAADPAIDALWINCTNDARIPVMEAIVRGNASRARPLLGIACEKPLARTLKEALRLAELAREAGVPTGYLENEVFAPAVARGKEILWRRGVPLSGRPYLARAAEEHSGPHSPWFWRGSRTGGGVLNDMACHAIETVRYLLTAPGAPRASLKPVSVLAQVASLKWTRPEYIAELKRSMGVDYAKEPSEDYASCSITFEDEAGRRLIGETTTSWSFVGAGLRHTIELLGPEYSMRLNTLDTGLEVFFSRRVRGEQGEDLVEKQNAEQGLMPVVPDEPAHYGYAAENRHMVAAFRTGRRPDLTFDDGVEVVRLLMAAYKSAECGAAVDPSDPALLDFEPAVSRGQWKPKGNAR
jgi:predicted dehydrogenase